MNGSAIERGIALVTGGATGIGAACVRELARAGFKVAIHCNQSREAAEELMQDLPGNPFVVVADLSKASGVEQVADEIRAREEMLDVLVNNAGRSIDATLFSAKIEDFDSLIETNLKSAWYLTKRLSRQMMRQKRGRMINISSVVGSTGNIGQSVYGMTKAALDNLTRTSALELAPYGILVNSVAPGFIETRMTGALSEEAKAQILSKVPLGRMGLPDEVARLVRFLAVEGSYCTGSVFHINGGMYGG